MVWAKRILSLVLLAVLVYFFLPLLKDLRAAGDLFRQARWGWLAWAVLIQAVSYGFLTWLNALALQPFSGRIGFIKLAGLLTSMAFIQIAIPSAGASGVALRVRLLAKFGYKSEESIFSLFVESIAEIIVLVAVSMVGVAYLLWRAQLTLRNLFWLGLIGVILSGLMVYGWRLALDERRSRAVLVKWVSGWNRVMGRIRWLDLSALEPRLVIFQSNLRKYFRVGAWKFVLAAVGKVLLDVVTLGAAFHLFGYAISPAGLLTGYGLILTFSGTAALPAGLGMADASVPVIFSWLGVPASVALAAGLTYRLIAFWLVRFIGFFSWQFLEANPKKV